jgi:hypothetical protein
MPVVTVPFIMASSWLQKQWKVRYNRDGSWAFSTVIMWELCPENQGYSIVFHPFCNVSQILVVLNGKSLFVKTSMEAGLGLRMRAG